MGMMDKLNFGGVSKEERFKKQEEAEKKHVAFIKHKQLVLNYLAKKNITENEWYVLFHTDPQRKGSHQIFEQISQDMFSAKGEVYIVANGTFALHGVIQEGKLIKRERKKLDFDFEDTTFVFHILGATIFTQSLSKKQIEEFFDLAKSLYQIEMEIKLEEDGRSKIFSFAQNIFEMMFPERLQKLVNDTHFFLDNLTEKELEIFVDRERTRLGF